MKITAKVRGKDALYRQLRRTVPAVDSELRKELAKVGTDFVVKATAYVPKDEGDLARSIDWQFTRATRADASRSPAIVIMAGDDKGLGPADHVRYVEFGTVDTPKQPFFYPAYRLARRGIRSRLTRAIGRALKAAGFGKKR